MNAGEGAGPKSGPLANLSQTYFSGLDLILKGYEPALKGVGRYNVELVGLMSRRARAWMEIPARLGDCKTPQDLVKAQLSFWQTAAHDYADGWRRLTVAVGACAVLPGLNGAWGDGLAARSRDYISVSGAKHGTAAHRKPSEREAA